VVHRDDIRSCIEQTQPLFVNSDRRGGARDRGQRPETATDPYPTASHPKRSADRVDRAVGHPACHVLTLFDESIAAYFFTLCEEAKKESVLQERSLS
jgi:hypothetical protein